MDPMKQRWIKALGATAGKKHSDLQWFPKALTGQYALPASYEINACYNPSPAIQRKAKKGKRIAKLAGQVKELRWLLWRRDEGLAYDVDEQQKIFELQDKIKFHGIHSKWEIWPKGWDERLIECMRGGLAMKKACELLGLERHAVSKLYKRLKGFSIRVNKAKASYQKDLVDQVTRIATGGSESAKLKAVTFLLERRYPEEYGQKQEVSVQKHTAPMDILMGTEDESED